VKKRSITIAAFAAALLAGCAANSSPVGLLDVQRLTANWPQYNNAQNQLLADERAVQTGSGSTAQKRALAVQLQAKYGKISDQLVAQIKDAAQKVAQQKNLRLVLTREFVGYGGTDITPDVEKILGITESSPSPSPSP
jgi:Skp family chaperone for outer membrane proteins